MTAARRPHRCLYEILGINLTASADEIRAAYRKLALKLHPDKAILSGLSMNQATAQFQEMLGAYEVLSDPRERSWYDSHRSQFFYYSASSSCVKKSGNSASSSSTKNCDFDINLSPFFRTSVYSGYGDSGNGFFKVYGDLFQTLF
jgi:DnaJ family protein A protein 5